MVSNFDLPMLGWLTRNTTPQPVPVMRFSLPTMLDAVDVDAREEKRIAAHQAQGSIQVSL